MASWEGRVIEFLPFISFLKRTDHIKGHEVMVTLELFNERSNSEGHQTNPIGHQGCIDCTKSFDTCRLKWLSVSANFSNGVKSIVISSKGF